MEPAKAQQTISEDKEIGRVGMANTQFPTQEIGYASSINNYLVWIDGLPNIKINEIIINKEGSRCMVTAIKANQVGALILDDVKIEPGDEFRRTGQQLSIGVGDYLLGRMINPLGQPVDGKGRLSAVGKTEDLDKAPLGISARAAINRQFETGIALIDTLVPLAYGQRELLIGDPRSGKSSFLVDLIVNQKNKGLVCVLCIVGKPAIEIKRLVAVLADNGAMDYSVVVAAAASERAPLIYLTPSVGVTLAEYFQSSGRDVLLVMDDLGVHAKFYREISLLSGRAPGRESYPGDIFYQHARLVERAGNFTRQFGGRSITALPVIETSLDDFSGFMSTNLMGMTDGHLLFNSERYHQGFRPSVDVSLSVSRVGRQTQFMAQKRLSSRVKSLLAESANLETFARLGSDISAQTKAILNQAEQIKEILKQDPLTRIPVVVQMMMLGLTFTPFLQNNSAEFVKKNKKSILNYFLQIAELNKYSLEVVKMRDENELIKSLDQFLAGLGQVCQAVTTGPSVTKGAVNG